MTRIFFSKFTFISNFLSRCARGCAIKIHLLSRRAYTHTFKLALHALHGDVTSRTMFSLQCHTESRCNEYCVLQCVAVCCSVLQCVAVYCSVMQCTAVCGSVLQCGVVCCSVLQCVAVCCTVCFGFATNCHSRCVIGAAQMCVAVCCSMLQCFAVHCSVLQCVAVCCSVLQCVLPPIVTLDVSSVTSSPDVCCSMLQCVAVCCSVLQCVLTLPQLSL